MTIPTHPVYDSVVKLIKTELSPVVQRNTDLMVAIIEAGLIRCIPRPPVPGLYGLCEVRPGWAWLGDDAAVRALAEQVAA